MELMTDGILVLMSQKITMISRSWDGCPDIPEQLRDMLDADYDGIADDMDNCPSERENYNKFQDEDGCPDVLYFKITGDADNDGIEDDLDQCPTAKETYNRFQDG